MGLLKACSRRLFDRVDISSLVFLRVAFGSILLWEIYRYIDNGWIERHYLQAGYLFHYEGFSWVKPFPGRWLHVHFYAMGLVSIYIILGLFYRASAVLSFLGFTYIFLLDQGEYLNHFYLVCLLCFLMIFIPVNRAWSLDAFIWPKIRSATAPAWALWLFRGQMAVVYLFGAIAKINKDWFRGEPMRTWLADKTDTPYLGRFFKDEWCVYLMSYSGVAIDLLCVPLLLWRRTRPFAFCALTLFHLLNSRMFNIGVFPWLGIATSTLFFPPDWPKRLYREVVEGSGWLAKLVPVSAILGGYAALRFNGDVELVPMLAGTLAGALAVLSFFDLFNANEDGTAPARMEARSAAALSAGQVACASLFFLWFAVQIAVPLRHFFVEGDVAWTQEGHRFSWRMKLHDRSGSLIRFYAIPPGSDERWELDVETMLSSSHYAHMRARPQLVRQMAVHLAKELEAAGYGPVEIHVRSEISLNGRPRQLVIDPEVDLARVPNTWGHAPWILPMKEDPERDEPASEE